MFTAMIAPEAGLLKGGTFEFIAGFVVTATSGAVLLFWAAAAVEISVGLLAHTCTHTPCLSTHTRQAGLVADALPCAGCALLAAVTVNSVTTMNVAAPGR